MNLDIGKSLRIAACAALAVFALSPQIAAAQIQSIDPDTAIDGDLSPPATAETEPWIEPEPLDNSGDEAPVDDWSASNVSASDPQTPAGSEIAAAPAVPADDSTTYHKDDLIGAAQGVFGTGAQGLASMIEDLLKKQGEPNGYIVGREAGGAVAIGLRYGSGTLHHKVEGNRPVYWTGPSLGFDLGANAGKAFVLVYNLYDTQDLFHRYGAGEGQAYLVGGFHVSYLRKGDVVLIPVRMGAGLRLGANVGYMRFSEKQKWLPF